MEGKKYREISYAEQAARDNSIFSAWTRKWGIHVRPWYKMDKLKFSFVDVGTSGKGNSFDICMDVIKFGFPCFKKWANDILSPSGRFEKMMALDAKDGEQFPKRYKYVTGEKGDKSIGICNGKNGGYVINASSMVNGKRVNANIPVDFGDLTVLAQNFENSYKGREEEISKLRKEAEENITKQYKDEDGAANRPIIADEEMENAKQIDASVTSKNTHTEEKKDTQENVSIPMKVSLSGLPTKLDGEFCFDAINKETGSNIKLYVTNKVLSGEQKDTWANLSNTLKERRVAITFLVKMGDKIMIEKIA